MNQSLLQAMYSGMNMKPAIHNIDDVFLTKQDKVLKTEKGKKYAEDLNKFLMGFVQSIALGTPQGQEFFSKYKAGIEAEYEEISKPEEFKQKEQDILNYQQKIKELEEKLRNAQTS